MTNLSQPMTSSDYYEAFIATQHVLVEKKEMLQTSRREAEQAGNQIKKQAHQFDFSTLAEKRAFVREQCASYHQQMRDAEDAVAEASRVSDEAWASYERARGL